MHFLRGRKCYQARLKITSQNGRTPIVAQRFTTSASVSALPAISRFSPHPAISREGREGSHHRFRPAPNHARRSQPQTSSDSKNNFRWHPPRTWVQPKHLLRASAPAVRAPPPTTLYRSSRPSQELPKHE